LSAYSEMKILKLNIYLKLSLLLLLIIQVPFIYEVLESYWLHSYLESLPRTEHPGNPFNDVKGMIHVHSAAGGHSKGTYPEIIEAGKKAGAKWIFMTEHPREPKIFNRITDPEITMIYGWEEPRDDNGRQLRDDNSEFLIFSEFKNTEIPTEAGGVEIFNLAESAEAYNNAYNWISWIYHQFTIPEMFFFHIWDLNRERFDAWDDVCTVRHITATAGNDAHQNLGLVLETGTGKKLFSIHVDPYELSMKSVSNHLLLPKNQQVTEKNVISGLKKGSSYICFDLMGNPEGFSFHAENSSGLFPPGSTVPSGSKLRMISPLPVHFKVLWLGKVFKELEGTDFTVPVTLAGSYRVEVSFIEPPHMLEDKPWIITNPIYVDTSS